MKYFVSVAILSSLLFSSCSEEAFDTPVQEPDASDVINIEGQIVQEAVTRANDDGFADGDKIGIYIVDYEGTQPGTLKNQGNRADNVHHTFDETTSRWTPAYNIYWKDRHTRIDVFGYYPIGSPSDVNNYKFTVLTNQARTYDDGTMGDYEASDFLWGKVAGVEPTPNAIRIPFAHRMANARVTLVEGSGFDPGEWNELEKQVLVTNTIQNAVIDLATGSVTPEGDVSTNSIIPTKRGDEWRAIVVPQTIPSGTTMFNITLDGVSYKFSKTEECSYVSGKMNNFSIKIDQKVQKGDYTLTLISESITPWENDLVSHDAVSKEYIVVNSTPGTLKDAITAAGKDYKSLKNLKVTGEIDVRDFYFMRDEMTHLQALNLKEVKVKAYTDNIYFRYEGKEDEIPVAAFLDKRTLTRFVFPDKLRSIACRAFENSNISGSLVIPEGVIDIQWAAFKNCTSLTGTLSLPSTLKYIANYNDLESFDEELVGNGETFMNCGFISEIIIPEGVRYIGSAAFLGCSGIYGNLVLPSSLKTLGDRAFSGCKNLNGSLKIPQGVSVLRTLAFNGCGFNGNLTLHDGISEIEAHAFGYCKFKGELILPKNLEVIHEGAFYYNDFSGDLKLPETLISIGAGAFGLNGRLSGTLKFGNNLSSIGSDAFNNCSSIQKLIFSENIETIGQNAFQNCFGVGAIICESEMPPYLLPGVFDGVAKDNFTLEVPETAVAQYQTAPGWSDFKRIAAHHELVCRPSVACALSTEHKQTLVIDAEGEWEVASIPDWCELSQTSGNKKTEITLTIKAGSTTESREGDVVFQLKDKDYTHSCHVSQYGYQYGEDEFLALQTATKGSRGGINIVIMGDGYDAKQIADGSYLSDMKKEMEYFFGIEPYTTYRDYFNVYTAFPISTETGVGTVNTIRYNKFNTIYVGGVGLKCDYDEVFSYALGAPTVNSYNLNQTLIIIVPNSTDYGGITQMWEDGSAIAFCPRSDYGYPLDSRGLIQHEAGGHGFGKLADEYIYHNAFIDFCDCSDGCGHADAINIGKSWGWYDNIELTGKMHEVGWSHLIFDSRYSDLVDIYEGGFMHSRGVFRSEQNSCMNNNIPYYSTIC
ncbi:MAG: leucine-rich repeat protein, partial [Muribaculaceae bacterium]|nr:leucine-rich repeat protein [Muribaculaceae bacterium]